MKTQNLKESAGFFINMMILALFVLAGMLAFYTG